MFSGIIEEVGRVVSVTGGGEGRTLVIDATFAAELADGHSVAVDGTCLTATATCGKSFSVQAGAATLARTVAGKYQPGSRVNLERALGFGDRMHGHLVQGHVDGFGSLLARKTVGATQFLDFEIPPDVFATTVLHGSIALNGISLTVNQLRAPATCQVAIIPHTWRHTNLRRLQPGDAVNVEADLIGKYVRRMVEPHAV